MAPFAGKGSIPESAWIDIGVLGLWSPDGKLIYDISNRDGYPCIWAQRLDAATKRRVG
jgi:Tol biopolymer transport system component